MAGYDERVPGQAGTYAIPKWFFGVIVYEEMMYDTQVGWYQAPRQSHLIFSQYWLRFEIDKGLALIPSWSTDSRRFFYV